MSTRAEPNHGQESRAVPEGAEPDRVSRAHGSDAQCVETLFTRRWPRGFVCPQCRRAEDYTTMQTRGLLQCKRSRNRAQRTAGTVFAYSKLPLTNWFPALYQTGGARGPR